jgi:hypothetical protein
LQEPKIFEQFKQQFIFSAVVFSPTGTLADIGGGTLAGMITLFRWINRSINGFVRNAPHRMAPGTSVISIDIRCCCSTICERTAKLWQAAMSEFNEMLFIFATPGMAAGTTTKNNGAHLWAFLLIARPLFLHYRSSLGPALLLYLLALLFALNERLSFPEIVWPEHLSDFVSLCIDLVEYSLVCISMILRNQVILTSIKPIGSRWIKFE